MTIKEQPAYGAESLFGELLGMLDLLTTKFDMS